MYNTINVLAFAVTDRLLKSVRQRFFVSILKLKLNEFKCCLVYICEWIIVLKQNIFHFVCFFSSKFSILCKIGNKMIFGLKTWYGHANVKTWMIGLLYALIWTKWNTLMFASNYCESVVLSFHENFVLSFLHKIESAAKLN